MPTAVEIFQQGRLNDAIAAAIEAVRNKPGDIAMRWSLCNYLSFAGDLERAEKHLDLISQQDPKNVAGISLFRQLLRAEQARRQFYAEGRVPELIGGESEDLRLRLAASILLREGKLADAAKVLTTAEERRQHVSGVCNGKSIDDFRDLDDFTASFFEVLTSTGKYYWIPINRVRVVEFREPQSPRDLLWRRARMAVRDGPDGEVFIPALYANSHAEPDDALRLGRLTDWRGGEDSPVRGVGQRMFLAGEESLALGDLTALEFNETAPAGP